MDNLLNYYPSPGKLAWIIHAKKTCPKCGSTLKKTECSEPNNPPYYQFACPVCNATYSAYQLLSKI